MSALSTIFSGPAFTIPLTLALYWASLRVERRYPRMNSLLLASIALVFALHLLHIPYAHYRAGGDLFLYLLGPATVALGVPMYHQGAKLKGSLKLILTVVLAGSVVGMITAGGVAWLLGASRQVVMSAIPKSVTTPIAIQVSSELHGNPAITAAMVLVTGLLGAVIGPGVLRLSRIQHDHAVGCAMGTSSHAIGTATLLRSSEIQGSVSSLAMAAAGVMTSVLAMLLTLLWRL
ncbi:MAG: LrgB family protein [Acidobacteriaceae bacterium]